MPSVPARSWVRIPPHPYVKGGRHAGTFVRSSKRETNPKIPSLYHQSWLQKSVKFALVCERSHSDELAGSQRQVAATMPSLKFSVALMSPDW